MNYVVTLYDVEDDEFVTNVCRKVSGVKDLGDRLESLVDYYQRVTNNDYKIVSVVRIK